MGTRAGDLPEAMRMLARHQWVREHGTARISFLVGRRSAARSIWTEWLSLSGRAAEPSIAFDADETATRRQIERLIAEAVEDPRRPVALIAPTPALVVAGRDDRVAAMLEEGIVKVRHSIRGASRAREAIGAQAERARSLAELTLFEALEATPATAGKFALNQRLVAARFGTGDAEIDLLARAEKIAVEVDGFHHFGNPDSYRRDRRKDLLLQAKGYIVVRVLAEDVHERPRAAVKLICEALAHASRRAQRREDADADRS